MEAKKIENKMESEVLELTSYTGKLILQNGGEVYRAEDVICRVGRYYGYEIETFVTLTCIVVSIKGKDKQYHSLVTRVTERSWNLNKVHKANKLIRQIENYTFDEFYEKMRKIDKSFYIELYRYMTGFVFVAIFIGLLFGGGLNEAIIGGISGFVTGVVTYAMGRIGLNGVMVNLGGSIVCTLIACIGTYLGYTEKTSTIIIACLMNLVPGLVFVNGIRDFVAGDLIAGSSRLMEALMIATSLAIGAGIVIKCYTALGGVIY